MLVDIFSQKKLDLEKQLENFAYGIVIYPFFPGQLHPLTYFPCSSSISITKRPFGLWTTS
jgi:hypothetical protein